MFPFSILYCMLKFEVFSVCQTEDIEDIII